MAKRKTKIEDDTAEDPQESTQRSTPRLAELKKIKFDPSDDITWHDIVAIILFPLFILWWLIKLVLWPVRWNMKELKKLWNFMREAGHDTPMSQEERDFFESLPMLYIITGIVGGTLLGIIFATGFSERFIAFFTDLNIVDGLVDVLNFIGDVLNWFLSIIVAIVTFFVNIVLFIVEAVTAILAQSLFLALLTLGLIGLGVMIIWFVVTETAFFKNIQRRIGNFIKRFRGLPESLSKKIGSWYRRVNHNITVKILTEERLSNRTHTFFRKVVINTFVLALFVFVSGVVMAFNTEISTSNYFQITYQIGSILVVMGIISALSIYVLCLVLDKVARQNYIPSSSMAETHTTE